MSVFHGIRDISTMEGPAFFKAAWRLPSYSGAVQDTLKVLVQEQLEVEKEKREKEKTLSLEDIARMYPAAPSIGESVPMFEVVRAT
jgi:hypothetical protein